MVLALIFIIRSLLCAAMISYMILQDTAMRRLVGILVLAPGKLATSEEAQLVIKIIEATHKYFELV